MTGGQLPGSTLLSRVRDWFVEPPHPAFDADPATQPAPGTARADAPAPVPEGAAARGRVPEDAAVRAVARGRVPEDAAVRAVPRGRVPEDAAVRAVARGRVLDDAASLAGAPAPDGLPFAVPAAAVGGGSAAAAGRFAEPVPRRATETLRARAAVPRRRVAGLATAGAPLAVLAPAALAHRLGAAVALASAGTGVALVSCWGARPSGLAGLAATPAARRLAASLTARGLAAVAGGRLVTVCLPEPEPEAVAALHRAEAAAAHAACVVALGTARGQTWDGALAERAAVLVHGCDGPVEALAVERMRDAGIHAVPLAPPPRAVVALAARGLALPAIRAVLRDAE